MYQVNKHELEVKGMCGFKSEMEHRGREKMVGRWQMGIRGNICTRVGLDHLVECRFDFFEGPLLAMMALASA